MVTEQQKTDLLEILYRLGGGDISKRVLLQQAKFHLEQWDDNTFWETAQALIDEKLIDRPMGVGFVGLSLEARRRIEKLHESPGITHNETNIGTNINSPIQQGGAYALLNQSIAYNNQELDELRRLVDFFEKHIDDLKLDLAAKRKATSQIETIKAQLRDEPDPVIVKQAGRTLRNITEGVIVGLIVTAIQPSIWAWVPAIFEKLF